MSLIKVGCCGFAKGIRYYLSRFKLVEIQQTFYKPPQVATALKWRQQAPEDFEFTLKAWQLITHPASSPTYRRASLQVPKEKENYYGFFRPSDEVWQAWHETSEIAQVLKARVIIFQCPARFVENQENVQNMRLFFRDINRKNFILAWEPRGDWSKRTVQSLCQELGLVHCVDPMEREALYGEIRYFRLHGGQGYRHQYSSQELESLKKLVSGETYFLFNNLTMYEDALKFVSILGKST